MCFFQMKNIFTYFDTQPFITGKRGVNVPSESKKQAEHDEQSVSTAPKGKTATRPDKNAKFPRNIIKIFLQQNFLNNL